MILIVGSLVWIVTFCTIRAMAGAADRRYCEYVNLRNWE